MTYTQRTFMVGSGATTFGPAHVELGRGFADPGDASAKARVEPASAVAAVHAIKQLKARYFRAIDAKDWDLLKQQVTADVVIDTTASAGIRTTGADAFIAYLQATIGPAQTVHQGHMPEIEVRTPTTATGVWAMEDLLIWPDNIRGSGSGHCHETYLLAGDRWLISSSTLTRLWLDPAAAQRLFQNRPRRSWIGRWPALLRRRR
ncbi:nuclear transport factor 2 family protein [Nocardia vinacea]|uniref:Nuclear transport factor 2 family protein n=1 Tax=Nocardia vinacea TaxID=96468 RepID=A0ABZ1YJT9_9NOCA|nr:nuclear transport factor 2 family protein [Nocardia vinacea]